MTAGESFEHQQGKELAGWIGLLYISEKESPSAYWFTDTPTLLVNWKWWLLILWVAPLFGWPYWWLKKIIGSNPKHNISTSEVWKAPIMSILNKIKQSKPSWKFKLLFGWYVLQWDRGEIFLSFSRQTCDLTSANLLWYGSLSVLLIKPNRQQQMQFVSLHVMKH